MLRSEVKTKQGGGFEDVLFSPRKLGDMIHFDEYFSNGLKPLTRKKREIQGMLRIEFFLF